jgi:hypothetical protein
MGSVGGFAVPTVILVFTVAHEQAIHYEADFTLLVGLLVLSLLGCVTSGFAFAAIAGEDTLTTNLPPAAMYVGVAVILSITSVVASFEILAHIYLSAATNFFAFITAAGGITGAVFNAFGVIDDWEMRQIETYKLGPSDWFDDRKHAHIWALWLGLLGSVPIAVGLVLFLGGWGFALTPTAAQIAAGLGITVTFVAVILGALRTVHPHGKMDRGCDKREAIALQCVTGLSVAALLLVLPT